MSKKKKEKVQKYKIKRYNYDLSFCPHCYSKMDRNSGVCLKCGFRESSLNGATNALAKQAYKNFREDEVVFIKKLPQDVSYKKLLTLVCLTGFAGGHLYYIGRYKKAILYSIMFILSIISIIFFSSVSTATHGAFFTLLVRFVLIACGVYILDYFMDVGRVLFKRIKVPVLAPEKTEDYDRSKLELKEEK